MKQFQMREIREARAYAVEGGQALHLHTFNQGGHRLFKRYPEIAHLFDQNKERLIETAQKLGVRVIKVEKEGTESQHIDLCGGPLERAKALCEPTMNEPNPKNQLHRVITSGYPSRVLAHVQQVGCICRLETTVYRGPVASSVRARVGCR